MKRGEVKPDKLSDFGFQLKTEFVSTFISFPPLIVTFSRILKKEGQVAFMAKFSSPVMSLIRNGNRYKMVGKQRDIRAGDFYCIVI